MSKTPPVMTHNDWQAIAFHLMLASNNQPNYCMCVYDLSIMSIRHKYFQNIVIIGKESNTINLNKFYM